jgi:hypothetical protein
VCACVRKRESVCLCVYVCVSVCVRERERERLKESSFDVYPGLDGERKMKNGERRERKRLRKRSVCFQLEMPASFRLADVRSTLHGAFFKCVLIRPLKSHNTQYLFLDSILKARVS